ncbi:MAG TPA: hypothetical protein VM345_08485 [Acidimicrobiales bacterium]|nr:hypothetical protein [Acidimicrobiales bacterium]
MAAWLAAAAVAGTIAWQGVGIVTRQVTDERPPSLTAGELRALAADASAQERPPAVTSSSATEAESSTTTAAMPPSEATTTTTAPTAPPVPSATTAPPSSSTVSETRTYNLTGGSVALRFAPDGVSVVWATPNSGFVVEVEPEHVNGVKVEFESDAHRSRVDGWWSGGPQERVREEPR